MKPEITRSMIEIGTSIQREFVPLRDELHDLRTQLSRAARKLNIAISGGGTHRVPALERAAASSRPNASTTSASCTATWPSSSPCSASTCTSAAERRQALWLLHALSRYVPHFIALSASSPFVQGVDTGFDSARLNSVFAFPLSGRAPFVLTWDELRPVTSTR